MKKNPATESGIFNPRVFVAFILCSVGTLLAMLSFAQQAGRTPIYNVGNFTFGSTKQLLPGSPVLGFQDVEPEIKVDIFGNIYITAIEGVPAGVDLWKSTDNGASFVFLGQPDGAQCPAGSTCTNDAGIGGGDDSIDVSPGGYLYVSSLWLGNVTMSMSMDGGTGGVAFGQKWEVNPVAAGVPVDDRQWIAAYGPQTVYMSFRQTPGSNVIFVAKSTDGGKTFPQVVATFPATSDVLARREGNLVVDPYNGNIYTSFRPQVLNGHTRAELWFLKSTDGGQTWALSKAYQGPAGTDIGNVFPVLAVDRGGNVHLAFSQCDFNDTTQNSSNCQVLLTSSADQGTTWLPPVRVNNGPNTPYAIFPWIVAGSPGVVDITWYGSTVTDSTKAADWHMFFAQTTNALAQSPVFKQVQAVPQVVHNQDICLKGGACGGNRNLAEYYQITLDRDGNANIAFTDDVTNNTSGSGNTWYTKQTTGLSAYHPPTALKAATFAANVALPLSSAGDSPAEPNMKADSHNCLFSASPGRPDAWKSTDAGTSFFLLPNPVANETGLIGGDEDIMPFPQPSGARPDALYFADLGVSTVHIRKSTDGGATWFAPGAMGAAGEVSASVDRQWLSHDRSGSNQTVYLWEHEFVSEELRMSALVNDTVWSPFASGLTDPELLVPLPGGTLPNTNVAPTFVDPATHIVYGFFCASTTTTNAIGGGFGKLPNVWEADGAGTFTSGVPPGPFTNHPVFKGLIDSPTNPAPPASAMTFGSNTGNLFNGAAIDSAGNIYVTWATPNARTNKYELWFASSHDHGKTYYGPFRISSNGTQATSPWIAAGDNGRVDIAFYGTNGTESPNTSTTDQWNVFIAQSLNAADREPVFTVSQASDHIMHVGPICNVGILCGGGTRQLLDFFQVAIGPDGLANIAYADDGASNGPTHVSYARQSGGPLALTKPVTVTCNALSITISASPIQIHEGASATYTVSASAAPSQPLTVLYSRSGTASSTSDYTLSGTLGKVTIPAGQTSASFTLHALSDTDEATEPASETAIMTLQPGTGYALGTPSTATVTILR